MSDATKIELTDEIRARRVAVAKDVLEQIRLHKVHLHAGNYLAAFGDNAKKFDEVVRQAQSDKVEDLQAIVDQISPLCHVCARGALVLSKARLFDAVPVGSLVDCGGSFWSGDGRHYWEQEHTEDLLSDTFDPLTLAMIEAAFEQEDMTSCRFDDATSLIKRSIEFGRRFGDIDDDNSDLEACVAAVMTNIVENNGDFKP